LPLKKISTNISIRRHASELITMNWTTSNFKSIDVFRVNSDRLFE